MSNKDTPLKDLSEVEKLIIAASVNFAFNLLNNQINHIEKHDKNLTERLKNEEESQKIYILLKNFREVSQDLTKLFVGIFQEYSEEEIEVLTDPGMKLDEFFKSIYKVVACNYGEEE